MNLVGPFILMISCCSIYFNVIYLVPVDSILDFVGDEMMCVDTLSIFRICAGTATPVLKELNGKLIYFQYNNYCYFNLYKEATSINYFAKTLSESK